MDFDIQLPLVLPPELPITAHAEAIARAMRDSPVVIVCGDTGSGKTTQLPKIALNAGRGRRGLIGCTQPRRLAVYTMAGRLASELGQEPGGFVGWQHRFERSLSKKTRIKFMTDGILLAETRRDRLFRRYDTLIIDEAHERSLNIDFLLGLIKRVLPSRRDLRVVISSATLDAAGFSAFFDGAPVITVPGRCHPIELRWRPPEEGDDSDLPLRIATACEEVMDEGRGDILVFLPGEQDIREASEVLRGRAPGNTEVIPLLASLPAAEQARAFRLSPCRRIILATNVAETSVTVPGIRSVIDSGLARLNRYSHRTEVQRLLIEPISQASANQRMGRCGRTGPGVCIRLYDEKDFAKRERFTPPEILRTSLAGVILAMMDLNLGDIESFPFIEPPSGAAIREGYRKLELLGAIKSVEGGTAAWQLTRLGRQLPGLPVGPVLGTVLFAAERERALRDTLIVVAALECDNPRRRPVERQAEADRCHARFLSPTSDFAALLRLWRWYATETAGGSQSQKRRLCKENYLSYPKMREWSDLHAQLRTLCKSMKMEVDSHTGGEDGIHRALLRGLATNIGRRDPESGDYLGTRGVRFAIFPGSGLARLRERAGAAGDGRPAHGAGPVSRDWIVADDLIETSRLFARQVACVSPAWIESVVKPHCKYQYWDERWDGRRGFVGCLERVTFQGLVIADGRRRDLGGIDPATARRIFIREGLVAGDFPPPLPRFLELNLERCRVYRDAEAKTRRPGAYFDPEPLCRFYEERLPGSLCNASGVRNWLKRAGAAAAEALVLRAGELPEAPALDADFPDHITIKGERFTLSYYFEPGAEDDGVTCEVPAAGLALAAQWPSDWLVPGMLDEKIRWMIGVLPSRCRRLLQPLDEVVACCRTLMKPGQGRLTEALADALYRLRSVRVAPDAWVCAEWPAHLVARFLVYSESGEVLGTGRDMAALLRRFGGVALSPETAPPDGRWNLSGATEWCFEDIPEEVNIGRSGWPLIHYPALIDEGSSVGLRLFAERGTALAAHQSGLCRLFALALGKDCRHYRQPPSLPRAAALFLLQLEQTAKEIGEEIGAAALRHCFTEGRPAVRSRREFEERLAECYGSLHGIHQRRTRLVVAALQTTAELDAMLAAATLPGATLADIREQLAWLVFPGFAGSVPGDALEHFPRYLEACRVRIQRAAGNPDADRRKLAELAPHWRRYMQFLEAEHPERHDGEMLSRYRWLVEEFRVSLFAQELKTVQTVSAKRLDRAWDALF